MNPSEQNEQIEQTFNLYRDPSGVLEVRALNIPDGKYKLTMSGYFESQSEAALMDAIRDCAKAKPGGIYACINPAHSALLARCANRVKSRPEHTTADADIVRRRWILADLDSYRPAGISADDAEHDDALIRTISCRDWLRDTWGANTVLADSGNGGHCLIPCDLPNDADALRLVTGVLAGLAKQFNDDVIHVDTAVGNAARISKVYGTMARKGENLPLRPHRFARLLDVPSSLPPVSLETLQSIAALAAPAQAAAAPTAPTARASTGYTGKSLNPFNVQAFLAKHGIAVHHEEEGAGGWHQWALEACPFNPDHTNPDSMVSQQAGTGKVSFHCRHNSCKGNKWQQFRAHFEPEYKPFDPNRPNPNATPSRGARKTSTTPQNEPGEDDAEEGEESALPLIETNRVPLRDMSDAALDALITANDPPHIFVRAGKLFRVGVDEDSTPALERMTQDMTRGVLARIADFVSTSKDRGEVPVIPPQAVVADILSLPEYDLPPIAGIVTAPVFASDGTLCAAPGYHSVSRFFHHATPGFELPDTTPCKQNVDAALSLLRDDLLADFPFADEASRANALALLLLPFVRYMIDGATPLHLINSPAAGTGKGLLADACSLPFIPSGLPIMTPPNREEEWEKKLLACLLPAPSHILIDNARSLDSAHLDAVLTTPEKWAGRILGLSENGTVKVKSVFIATGNNLKIKGDLYRRSILINIDSESERPYEREGFRHPNLRAWIKENRAQLVGACVTLIRAWQANGSPAYAGPQKKGSFESWLSVIGGILENVGVTELLANSTQAEEQVDPEVQAWRDWLHDWYAFRTDAKKADPTFTLAFTAAEALLSAEEYLMDELGEKEGKARSMRMGKMLAAKVGRVFGEYRIKTAGKAHKTGNYLVEKINNTKKGDMGDMGDIVQRYAGESNKETPTPCAVGNPPCPPCPPADGPNGHSADLVAMMEAARENRAIPAGVKITLPGANISRPIVEDFNMRVREYASGYSHAIKNKDADGEAKYQALLNCCFEAWRQYQEDADSSDTSPRWA